MALVVIIPALIGTGSTRFPEKPHLSAPPRQARGASGLAARSRKPSPARWCPGAPARHRGPTRGPEYPHPSRIGTNPGPRPESRKPSTGQPAPGLLTEPGIPKTLTRRARRCHDGLKPAPRPVPPRFQQRVRASSRKLSRRGGEDRPPGGTNEAATALLPPCGQARKSSPAFTPGRSRSGSVAPCRHSAGSRKPAGTS